MLITLKKATILRHLHHCISKMNYSRHVNTSGVFSENFETLPSYYKERYWCYSGVPKNWGEAPIKVSSYHVRGFEKTLLKFRVAIMDGGVVTNLTETD